MGWFGWNIWAGLDVINGLVWMEYMDWFGRNIWAGLDGIWAGLGITIAGIENK